MTIKTQWKVFDFPSEIWDEGILTLGKTNKEEKLPFFRSYVSP